MKELLAAGGFQDSNLSSCTATCFNQRSNTRLRHLSLSFPEGENVLFKKSANKEQ